MSELARRLMGSGKTRSMSEDDVQFGFNPIDDLRRTVNTQSFTPEQAAQNRKQSLWEALSVIPGPGNVISAQDAYTGAGDAYNAFSAGDYKGGALASALAGLSGAGAVLGLPFGKYAKGAAKSGKDTLNIFAGPMAKTADHAALAKAQELAQSGASRDDIWRDTGWFQGVDGKWRFEIDDSSALPTMSVNRIAGEQDQSRVYLGRALKHPSLYEAYPEVKTSGIRYEQGAPGASYTEAENMIHLYGPKLTGTQMPRTDAVLHEGQHAVQGLEGFAPGGSPKMFSDIVEQDMNDGRLIAVLISKGMKPSDAAARLKEMTGRTPSPQVMDIAMSRDVFTRPWSPEDAYRRTAGEVEARNVQTRMDMSAAERRAKAPWLTQDVPDDQQIVRFR